MGSRHQKAASAGAAAKDKPGRRVSMSLMAFVTGENPYLNNASISRLPRMTRRISTSSPSTR